MKKIISLSVILFLTVTLMAQQTPSDIKDILVKLEKVKQIEDDFYDTAYQCLRQQIATSNAVNRAIWHSCMAEFLKSYLSENQYSLMRRSNISGEKNPDFKTWDLQTVVDEIKFHYFKSIENKELLQKEEVKKYAVLLNDTTNSIAYRPTVYDFLAFRALDFLNQNFYQMPEPLKPFEISDSIYFTDNQNFIKLKINSEDTLSLKYLSLKLMQELTAFHLQTASSLPLIDLTLRRLSYIKDNCTLENKDELYFNSLLSLEKQFQNQSGYEEIAYTIAQYYQNRAGKYDPELFPGYQWDYATAIQWYEKTIAFAPESIAGKNAKADIENIKRKSVTFFSSNPIIPNQPGLITWQYANCDSIWVRIIPIESEKAYNQAFNYRKDFVKSILKLKYIHQYVIKTVNYQDYRKNTGDALLPALPSGKYIIFCSPSNFSHYQDIEGISNQYIQVTNINVVHREQEGGCQFFVVDRTTGNPLKNATLHFEVKNYNDNILYSYSTKSDKNGIAFFKKRNNNQNFHRLFVNINYEKDSYFMDELYFYNNSYPNSTSQTVSFFTDRAIYRPGQTIYFKGIVLEKSSKETRLLPEEKVKVEFLDRNWQRISDSSFTSNEFGSFSGSFKIPENGITGIFYLRALTASHTISVEEYKRPQFEVTIDKPQESYKLNEQVKISGKATAYSGYAIDGATVKYRVVRTASYPFWRWWGDIRPSSAQQEIAQGVDSTDKDGNFTFEFQASYDKSLSRFQPVYNYKIMIDVTDVNGETQSATSVISIGTVSMFIHLDIPETICSNKGANKFKLTTTNLSDIPQAATVQYKIISLETPATYLHERLAPKTNVQLADENFLKKTFPYLEFKDENNKSNWKELGIKYSGTLSTPADSFLVIPGMAQFNEGYYKLILTSKDIYNQDVTLEKIVYFFKENSKECKAYTPLWLNVEKKVAEPGESVTVRLGSYLEDAVVLFEIISNDTLLKSEWVKLKRGRVNYQLEIKEEYRGNLIFNAFVAANNYVYKESVIVTVPFSNKKLDFEYITFRDKLLPGAKEEWKIKVSGKNGEKLAAELLCSMYDASLDAFKPNQFNFYINYLNKKAFNYFLKNSQDFSNSYYYSLKEYKYSNFERYYYDLNWRIGYFRRNYGGTIQGQYKLYESRAVISDAEEVGDVSGTDIEADKAIDIADLTSEKSLDSSTTEQTQIRSDFSETAFFFPQLQTDSEGNVLFTFTIPESLTKWKFQGLAHTNDLKTGTFEKFVYTQKKLMIIPNVPRFFREGDTLLFSAKVVNLNDEPLQGNVKVQFFNALNNQPVDILTDKETSAFNIEKGNSQVVNFRIAIPLGLSAITCRIMATSGNFSDGEEKIIPVLSNRMLVTETMPLYINGNQTKTFVFDKMKNHTSSTLQHFKYTLEFTANPVWYAIQALPYMMEYPYECNEQIFSRMYANSIAAHIVASTPKIKTVFDSWLNKSPDAFCSNLEKNQELKNIVLEETPWVMDAQNEAAAKERVALLFDIQRMARENNAAIDKLEKRQSASGGWAWFTGGRDSWHITQHIVAGFGHLQTLGIDISLRNNSLKKAVEFIDKEVVKHYNDLKNSRNINLNNDHLDYMATHYLYARSYHVKKYSVPASTQEAYNYYLGQAKKYWKKTSLYSQAMIALALYRAGDEVTAKKILADIKGRAQYHDEMGMYWKKEGYGWFWYEAPIERQAILIEAFDIILQDEMSVEKMQQWLLKQKQTQNWGTTKATAEACYALLLRGTNLLDIDSDITIAVGNSKIEVDKLPDAEAGTGYFKTSWSENEINDTMATVIINKASKGIAWGGLYWQYFENLEKITPAQSPLSIQRELYKVTLNERGETLTKINPGNRLKVGNKVRVRVEIRVDRDMEYVHLKDMRAAAFEPVNVFSQYKYQDRLWYYESTRDAATNFFFDYLPKGTYVFEYTLIASQSGKFSNGISTIQCMYAPEFSAHSAGVIVEVEP